MGLWLLLWLLTASKASKVTESRETESHKINPVRTRTESESRKSQSLVIKSSPTTTRESFALLSVRRE